MNPTKGKSASKAVTRMPMALAILGAIWVLYAHSPLGNFAESWGLVAGMVVAAIVVPLLLFIESEGRAGYSFIVLCVLMVMSGGLSLVCLVLRFFTNGVGEAELLSSMTFGFGVGFFAAYLSAVMSALVLMRNTKAGKGKEAAA